MRLLIVNPGTDIAGTGIALKYAFDRHAPNWTAHHVRFLPSVFDYPTDRPWGDLRRLWRRADLIHVMDDPTILKRMPRHPKVVVQYLGSRFRQQPAKMQALSRRYGARETGSLDLLAYPGVEWLPVTFDEEACRANGHPAGERVRVAHAPSNRTLKSTDLILDVLSKLPVDVDLIEKVTNRECLARKAQADIFVDELTYGYGLNAIECWAMGIPVVSGMTVGREVLTFDPPWVDATAETLPEVVMRLVKDPALRAEAAARGKAHVDRYHAPRAVVERVLELAA